MARKSDYTELSLNQRTGWNHRISLSSLNQEPIITGNRYSDFTYQNPVYTSETDQQAMDEEPPADYSSESPTRKTTDERTLPEDEPPADYSSELPTRPSENQHGENDEGSRDFERSSEENDEYKLLIDSETEEPPAEGPSFFDKVAASAPKAIKVLAFFFLLLMVLASAVISRTTLLFMTRNLGKVMGQDARHFYMFILVVCLSLPDLVKVVANGFRLAFGSRSRPSVAVAVVFCIQEVVHVVAVYGFVFKVLPFVDSTTASALMMTTGVIPFLVNIISTWRSDVTKTETSVNDARSQSEHSENSNSNKNSISVSTKMTKFLKGHINIFKILFIVLQMTSVFLCLYCIVKFDSVKAELLVWSVIFMVVVSLRWIENHSERTHIGVNINNNIKFTLIHVFSSYPRDKGKTITVLISSFLRLVAAIALFFSYLEPDIGNPFKQLSASIHAEVHTVSYLAFVPLAAHIVSTWLCYHLAQLACKLCMQTVGFALPLSLTGPVTVVLQLFIPDFGKLFSFSVVTPQFDTRMGLILTAFATGFISQLFLARHVWTEMPRTRLAFTERLFTLPHYCSPLLDLSLLHSRRRKDPEEQIQQPDTENFPIIKVCATMWHENKKEMTQFLQSIFRLDKDQCSRRFVKYDMKKQIDYYEFEVHIMFDNSFNYNSNGIAIPNEYVLQFIKLLDNAVSQVLNRPAKLPNPDRYSTPYGIRLEWKLPGGNKLITHLKDKKKIKIKKRWSQVMYMCYLLDFKMRENSSAADSDANRTYILALDGDIDFEPKALLYLIDRMKKNSHVGAACGRIKPKGSGPVVWYQKFEYAVGHWLQKSAEHIFGCVLCSPGCFSLFRGSALKKVMKTYTRKPETARHHLQYDQGEDRWLCTLLLQKGYRIEYVAASEALTYAPESFKEFFNQRRRWLPSTMANIADLIQSRASTVSKNPNISNLYIFYLLVLFVSSILGPATVLLAMESSVESVFKMPTWSAYLITYGPTAAFVFICLKLKPGTQIGVAAVFSTVFALLMMAVIAGTFVSIAREGWITPDSLFLYILIATFLIAGILHPNDIGDLVWGLLYFLCIPAGYLFLIIYSICNLNVTSWGTRENKSSNKPLQDLGQEDQSTGNLDMATRLLKERLEDDRKKPGCFQALFRGSHNSLTTNVVLLSILDLLQHDKRSRQNDDCSDRITITQHSLKTSVSSISPQEMENGIWLINNALFIVNEKSLTDNENKFWKRLLNTYLNPHEESTDIETKHVDKIMKSYRDKMAFAFFFVNGLWLVIMIAIQSVKQELNIVIYQNYGAPIIVHPLGLIFLGVFAILLLLQMAAMVKHRYGTLLHVLSSINIRKKKDFDYVKYADALLSDDTVETLSTDSGLSACTTSTNTLKNLPIETSQVIYSSPEDNENNIIHQYNRRYQQRRPHQRVRNYDREMQYADSSREVYDLRQRLQNRHKTVRNWSNQRSRAPLSNTFYN